MITVQTIYLSGKDKGAYWHVVTDFTNCEHHSIKIFKSCSDQFNCPAYEVRNEFSRWRESNQALRLPDLTLTARKALAYMNELENARFISI